MQSAETVLSVIRERGRRGLPLERLYRQLFNPQLFLLAYGRIYANTGAMTPGVSAETVDGMSLAKINRIIGALRAESYRWSAARRVWIPKKNGKLRPLGMPPWSDKLVAEVVRLLLEAYYDVRFSDHSHGFRPGRGCHTALDEVVSVWKGTHWFIEGDISDCFGSLDHQVMLTTLAEHIHDGRFLQLIDRMLKAGYLEDWRWNATLSGAPQGGVASPILSNIYLDRFDQFVEQQLLPDYDRGRRRRVHPAYQRVENRIAKAKRHGDWGAVRALRRERRTLPSQDPDDPGYRRLRYVRYCDDFLLGFAGPRHEAEQIKARIRAFLREELKLELSEPKTLITHATSQAALPRLPDQGPACRHEDHPEPPGGQRRHWPVRAQGCHPGPVRRLHEQGETRPTRPAAARRRLHDRRQVRVGVSRVRPVLPSRPGRVPPGTAALGHGDLDAQDPGRQAQVDRHQDGPQLQSDHRHP